jgi:hypothetical protein
MVFGRSLGSESNAGAFIEIAASFPEAGDAAVLVHHGYTYLLAPLVQIDLHGGAGLTDTAPDFFVGAGFSVRK